MNWVGFASMLILILVGIGMFFTGYSMGMQWVIQKLNIEVVRDGREAEDSDGPDRNHNDQ